MNIYLAASWPQRKRMRDIADHLSAIGYTATSEWIRSDSEIGMGPEEIEADPDKAVDGFFRDLRNIHEANRVAVFTDVPSSTGGFHVEYGYALGKSIPIDIIGPKPNVFYSPGMPLVYGVRHFADAGEWFDQLHRDKEEE
jgi:hypothetical protein